MKKTKTNVKENLRLKPLSLYPLTPEQALSAFFKIDPKKVSQGEDGKAEEAGPEIGSISPGLPYVKEIIPIF